MKMQGEQAPQNESEIFKLLRAHLHLAKTSLLPNLNNTVWGIFQDLKDGPDHHQIPQRLCDYSYEQIPKQVRFLTNNARDFLITRNFLLSPEDEQQLDWYIRNSITDWIAVVCLVAVQYLAHRGGSSTTEGRTPSEQLEDDISRHLPMAKILTNANHHLAVLDSAVKLGLHELRAALGQKLDVTTPVPGGSRANVFLRNGDGWQIEFDGDTAHFPPKIGFKFLHILISSQGKQLGAMELAHLVDKPATADRARTGASRPEALSTDELEESDLCDAGEIMDDKYLQSLKGKIQELVKDIAEATEKSDAEEAERLTEEKDQLVRHLGTGIGLGGRKRKAVDPHERARKRALVSIQRVMETIGKKLPSLQEHLVRSVKTGRLICYEPDRLIAWITE